MLNVKRVMAFDVSLDNEDVEVLTKAVDVLENIYQTMGENRCHVLSGNDGYENFLVHNGDISRAIEIINLCRQVSTMN